MSSSEGSEEEVEVVFTVDNADRESTPDPPMSEWSSLEEAQISTNPKKVLYQEGLYSPGSGQICSKYITQSDSDIFRHPYYKYPAVLDPGIKTALLSIDRPLPYPDDGQEMYLALCQEMDICMVRMFYKNLLSEEINLSYYCVDPASVRAMAMALQYNRIVKRFNLTDNFLSDDACYHLGQMLICNITLKELNLSGCRIGRDGLFLLGNGLLPNRGLQVINLSRNAINDDGGEVLAKQIIDGFCVPKINLSNNGLGTRTAVALREALEYNNKMTHLDLSWNNFFTQDPTARFLVQLAESKVLTELNLSWNSMEGDKVATAIGLLMLVPSLRVLDISHNRFRNNETIALLVANLQKSKNLHTFDISDNPLTPGQAYNVIAKMLRPRVKLQSLLMNNIWVEKKFLLCLDRVMAMKVRKNFKVEYGGVYSDYVIEGPDPRRVLLQRAHYLGTCNKRRKTDIALFFLGLYKENSRPWVVKDVIDRAKYGGTPLDEDFINELGRTFPMPKTSKGVCMNMEAIVDYVHRLWPDKKLPVTPPPEPEPEPEPEPPPPPPPSKKEKGKGKGKGKK